MNPHPINGAVNGNAHTDGIVRFETNIPVDLALKYADGLPVEGRFGDQVMYTLADGRKMYVSPIVATKLNELEIQPGEPVRITKQQVREGRTNRVRWNVERLEDHPQLQPPATQAAAQPQPSKQEAAPPPRPTASPTAKQQDAADPNMVHTLIASAFAATMKGAIDVAVWAQTYAASKGLELRFSEEDIRSMASTMFIQLTKEQGVQPWRIR